MTNINFTEKKGNEIKNYDLVCLSGNWTGIGKCCEKTEKSRVFNAEYVRSENGTFSADRLFPRIINSKTYKVQS